MVKDSDSFLIYQSIVCISLWCLLTSQKQPWSIFCCHCSTKMFFLYSKTMFLHPSANIHQRVKLGACVWCKGVAAFYFKKQPFVCAREPCMHVCVCAWVQKAPIGMNYLAESPLLIHGWLSTGMYRSAPNYTRDYPNSPSSLLQYAPVSPYNPAPVLPSMLKWSSADVPFSLPATQWAESL